MVVEWYSGGILYDTHNTTQVQLCNQVSINCIITCDTLQIRTDTDTVTEVDTIAGTLLLIYIRYLLDFVES